MFRKGSTQTLDRSLGNKGGGGGRYPGLGELPLTEKEVADS